MPNTTTEQRQEIIDRLESMSTFDLALKLARQELETEFERTEALLIIQKRELKPKEESTISSDTKDGIVKTMTKPPLKGSKTEKIYNLFKEGKTPVEVYDILTSKKITVYYPEIYRVQREYFPDRVKKKNK